MTRQKFIMKTDFTRRPKFSVKKGVKGAMYASLSPLSIQKLRI